MRRFKKWLMETFLPAWAKDTVYFENRVLKVKLEQKDQEIKELNAYIDGLETALRSMRRQVIINNEVKQ